MWFTPKIIKKIEKAGLIGRGCNNFPVAKKWLAVRRANGKEKFVVCNVSESEPGTFKDHYVLKNYAEKVLDGMQLAMDTVKAKRGFVYLNPEYFAEFQAPLRKIIEEKFYTGIELFEKPRHDYIGGEETAALNSLEGKRVEPRLKPPYPTIVGFEGQPTLINNPETFYAVSLIAENKYKNTRFYSLSGDGVEKEVKELPVDITVKKMLEEFGHKPSEKYFYLVGGGAAGTCYNFKQLNRKFDSVASVVIYSINEPEEKVVMNWLEFFENESCGQCVPCREGTYRLRNLMRNKFVSGVLPDQAVLDDLVFTLENTSFCALGKVSTNAVLSYLKNVKK